MTIDLAAIRARVETERTLRDGDPYYETEAGAWDRHSADLDATDQLLAEVKRLDEVTSLLEAEGHPLITRQGDLLTGVANALRGQPPELTSWSHHDLPELAVKTVAERDRLRAALDAVTALADEAWGVSLDYAAMTIGYRNAMSKIRAALALAHDPTLNPELKVPEPDPDLIANFEADIGNEPASQHHALIHRFVGSLTAQLRGES